jgi:hypothetical protein
MRVMNNTSEKTCFPALSSSYVSVVRVVPDTTAKHKANHVMVRHLSNPYNLKSRISLLNKEKKILNPTLVLGAPDPLRTETFCVQGQHPTSQPPHTSNSHGTEVCPKSHHQFAWCAYTNPHYITYNSITRSIVRQREYFFSVRCVCHGFFYDWVEKRHPPGGSSDFYLYRMSC